MSVVRIIAVASLMVGLSAGARAAILYNNIGADRTTPDQVGKTGPTYNSFSTDSSGVVDTITLLLDNGGHANPSGSVDVGIFDNASNMPNNELFSFGSLLDTDPRLVFAHPG
jgi:hypothetical protein